MSPRPLQIDSESPTSTQESNDQKVKDDSLSTSSQTLLAHEEIVIADSTMEDVEGEVVREVRSLISDPPHDGWIETEERMVYHTNESEWASEGVPDDEMMRIKQQQVCKTATNAGCVKYLYDLKVMKK